MSGAFVRLRIGDEHYALPVDDVLEVVELGLVERVPGATSSALGVRAHKGRPLPVFDLGVLLGQQPADDRQQILVAAHLAGQVGLAVDEVVDVCELPDDRTPDESDCLHSRVLVGGQLVGIVELATVIAKLESESDG